MIWKLHELIQSISCNRVYLRGKWVPARPINYRFVYRLKAAWLVLHGKADAVIWPEGQ